MSFVNIDKSVSDILFKKLCIKLLHRVWYGYVPARSSFITIIITISDTAAAGRIQLKLMLWSSKVYKDCILPSSSSSSSLGKVSYKKENLDELYKFKIWMFILMLLTRIPIYSWDDQLFIVFFSRVISTKYLLLTQATGILVVKVKSK